MTVPYWKNRLCRADEIEVILDLIRVARGDQFPELDRAIWEWRYLTKTGCRPEVFMAEHEGHPIGILHMATFDCQWGAQPLAGVMITGLVTHPDHRRRGIFRTLIDSVAERATAQGSHFIMGTPNEAALPGYIKFGNWIYPGLIPMHMKIVNVPVLLSAKTGRLVGNLLGAIPQLYFRSRPDPLADETLTCEQVTHVPDELDEIADEFARDCDRLMIRRSADYWNWRYHARPDSPYHCYLARRAGRLVGAVVTSVRLRAGIEVGLVLDLVARGGLETIRQLLRIAERDLRARGVGLITCQASSSLLEQALHEEKYRRPKPERLPKKFHYVYRPTGVPGLPAQPTQISDWHLTFGDSDNT